MKYFKIFFLCFSEFYTSLQKIYFVDLLGLIFFCCKVTVLGFVVTKQIQVKILTDLEDAPDAPWYLVQFLLKKLYSISQQTFGCDKM